MLTLEEFFDRPAFTAAYTKPRGNRTFADYYKRLVKSFYAIFKKDWSGIACGNNPDTILFNNAVVDAKDTALKLGNAICQVLSEYQNGRPFRAEKIFFKVLEGITVDLQQVISATDVDSPLNGRLFKVRVSDNPAANGCQRSEMFHIPLHLRHLVKSNRFSIPVSLACILVRLFMVVGKKWADRHFINYHFLDLSRRMNIVNTRF